MTLREVEVGELLLPRLRYVLRFLELEAPRHMKVVPKFMVQNPRDGEISERRKAPSETMVSARQVVDKDLNPRRLVLPYLVVKAATSRQWNLPLPCFRGAPAASAILATEIRQDNMSEPPQVLDWDGSQEATNGRRNPNGRLPIVVLLNDSDR